MFTQKSILDARASIIKNWMMWATYLVAVFIVASDDVLCGLGTVGALMGSAYFVHRFSHEEVNFFTVLHHYHHEHNNWFAYFSQMMMELLFGLVVIPGNYAGYAMHPWATMLFVLIYSSVHNVNYGLLKVNQVHARHHENVHENIGPDVCDILFGTKHGEAEDTTHYVPNIILAACATLLVKKLDVVRPHRIQFACILGGMLYLAASWHVWTTATSSSKFEPTREVSLEKQKRRYKRGRKQRGLIARKSRRVPVHLETANPS